MDHPELSDQLHAVNRRLRHGWSTQLSPYDLSPHQFRALAALVRSSGHHQHYGHPGHHDRHGHDQGDTHESGMRLSEIADRLRIAPRSATEVVDLLEAKQLVQRGPDPADRRATRVKATEEGQRLYTVVRAERLKQAEDFFAVLGDEDRAELSRLLDLLLEAHPRSATGCESDSAAASSAGSAAGA